MSRSLTQVITDAGRALFSDLWAALSRPKLVLPPEAGALIVQTIG
jgi:hypothetical protein